MQTPVDPNSSEGGGLGTPTNRKKQEPLPDVKDESKYVWRDHTTKGFEINQHGHLRTKHYGPGG
jgi:hypothetical protein